jgi:hypothetical protein
MRWRKGVPLRENFLQEEETVPDSLKSLSETRKRPHSYTDQIQKVDSKDEEASCEHFPLISRSARKCELRDPSTARLQIFHFTEQFQPNI